MNGQSLAGLRRFCAALFALFAVLAPGQESRGQPGGLNSTHTVFYNQDTSTYSTYSRLVPYGRATITHEVTGRYGDALGSKFTWTGPAGFSFQGFLPALTTTTRVVSFNTYLSIINETGTIEFERLNDGVKVSGPADFYRPVPSALLHYTGELLSSVFGSPLQLEFRSELNELGPDSYEYLYTVTNMTSNPITFDWPAAGLGGVVNPNTDPLDPLENVVSRRLLATVPAYEIPGAASFILNGAAGATQAGAFVPIPEPATAATLTCAAIAWALTSGRRRHRTR